LATLRIRALRLPVPPIVIYAVAIVANAMGIQVLLQHYW
jgi:hypothetical protein